MEGVLRIFGFCCPYPYADPLAAPEPDETMSELDMLALSAFTDNAFRAMSGGYIPPLENLSYHGRAVVGDLEKVRGQSNPLFFDSFAPVFFNMYSLDCIMELAKANGTVSLQNLAIGLRTFFFDQQVQKALAAGTQQIVYLGSGLDSRPLRLFSSATVVEVDQWALLEYKGSKLQEAGYAAMNASKYIKGDYLRIDLVQELIKVGLDLSAPTMFVWEGNSSLIPVDKSKALMKTLFKAFAQAIVVFDCIGPPGECQGKSAWMDSFMDELLQNFGDVLNCGQPMYPGRMKPNELAEAVDVRMVRSITAADFAMEMFGSEQAVEPYLTNPVVQMPKWQCLGGFTYFNVISNCDEAATMHM